MLFVSWIHCVVILEKMGFGIISIKITAWNTSQVPEDTQQESFTLLAIGVWVQTFFL